MVSTNKQTKKEKKESLFIYKLAKVNKTHEKLLRLPPAISDR
jgi:hypothetical protein